MVFPPVSIYLDQPNWPQQQHSEQGGEDPDQLLLPPPLPLASGAAGAGSIRPVSMADRARLAKLPQPEAALKCPRCDSTNTKFCYFNNYSLTQPRHFCKTCRRYWTRGGALRNVPVGGGCRRNKKTKGSSSKSPAPAELQADAAGSTSSTCTAAAGGVVTQLPSLSPARLPSVATLLPLRNHGPSGIGLNFAGFHHPTLGEAMEEQWRNPHLQQFPFFGGLEAPPTMYPFQGDGVGTSAYAAAGRVAAPELLGKLSSGSSANQMAALKEEENDNGSLDVPKPGLGIFGNEQYWGGNSWTDLSGFNPSSTSHML